MPQDARLLVKSILSSDNLELFYQMYRSEEKAGKEVILDFEKDYPGVVNEDNVNDILKELKARKKNESRER
ncbi:hypothetical protein SDC9_69006 [bioreactor metagenome]|uniref:Uncharacterized protein n=1 Tax=bioreactor metagenome TaxID=1076179 RepID=A0A644Y2G7_9ZZZZ